MSTVPYVDLVAQHQPLRRRLLEAVDRVLGHGQFILGPEVGELERRLAGVLGVREVVTVGSGTDAITLALRAHGVGPGDEVITVSHTFVATVAAVVAAGATPVFADVDEGSMLMDVASAAAAVTPRTRALIAVHLNGFPCAMDAIAELCRERGLVLIEDAAQALGARFRGRPVGTVGTGCFSLHPLKVVGACGDGGFVATNDTALAARLRLLRNLGLRDRDVCLHAQPHSRLDTLQAALLLVKLDFLEPWIEARRARAARYRSALAGYVELPPEEEPGSRAVHSAFVIRHPERDRLLAALRERGIDARIHYPLAAHQQPAFASFARAPLPATERVVSRILSLPVSPELGGDQQQHVIDAVREELRRR